MESFNRDSMSRNVS